MALSVSSPGPNPGRMQDRHREAPDPQGTRIDLDDVCRYYEVGDTVEIDVRPRRRCATSEPAVEKVGQSRCNI